jgi:multidrug efflux pump subunit AcrB
MQAPLARTVIGGLTSSTFITLLFIPCLYLLFERRREKHLRRAEAAG